MIDLDQERLTKNVFIPSWIWFTHQAIYEFTKKFVTDKIVVDCACGTGEGTKLFLAANAGFLYGFDVSPEALKITAKQCNGFDNFMLAQADAASIPLDNESIDTFISIETIEHIDDDQAFLREVVRTLRSDGLFICSTPNRTVTNPGKKIADKPFNKFHIREYSVNEFKALLGKYFNTVELYGIAKKNKIVVAIMTKLGAVLPFNIAVRLNQMVKVFKSVFWDRRENYCAVKLSDNVDCEFLVALCQDKKK